MFNKILLAGAFSALSALALLPLSAAAQAVNFTSSQTSTSALAVAEGVVNGNSAMSPPTSLSIISSVTSAGPNDFANAAAVGSAGLLTATTSTDSLVAAASAEAYARFTGTFASAGLFTLTLAFNTFETLAGGTGDSSLFVLLTNTVGTTTTTLFNNVYTTTGNVLLQYTLPASSTTQISLFLTSDAGTTAAGQSAQNFAQVAFTAAVPEPATWVLLGLGIGALALRRRLV